MPRLDGLEVTRQLAELDVNDPIKVVVVTTFDLDEYVHTALRAAAQALRRQLGEAEGRAAERAAELSCG
jgi:DNA-binding NarL/FixJ family response regulator